MTPEALAKLVADSQWLVRRIARRFSDTVPLEDLVQEGNLGLLRAAEKFDPNRGVAFATYASHWVRMYITQAAEKRSVVTRRVPGRGFASLYVESLNAPTFDDGDGTRLDSLIGNESPACVQLEVHQRRQRVRDVVRRNLDARARYIIEQRFFSPTPTGLRQLGEAIGVSAERVRQLEMRALSKLGRLLEPLQEEAR